MLFCVTVLAFCGSTAPALNRQFRGEIKDLQVFGSRISGRGAIDIGTDSGHGDGKAD
jgi:hypothetical protein